MMNMIKKREIEIGIKEEGVVVKEIVVKEVIRKKRMVTGIIEEKKGVILEAEVEVEKEIKKKKEIEKDMLLVIQELPFL